MWNNSLRRNYFAWVSPAAAAPKEREFTLNQWHFTLVLLVALALHALAVWGWQKMPKAQIIDIPVRVLNIKLGDEQEAAIAAPQAGNKSEVENTISRLVHDQDEATQARAQAPSNKTSADSVLVPLKKNTPPAKPRKENIRGKFEVREEGMAAAAPIMPVEAGSGSQYVRSNNTQADLSGEVSGAPGGQRDAQMVSHYEQLISLWIQKFKVYPEEARLKGMQGETVVRIRIDRQGNIRYYILERTTGHQPLDRAAIDMIRRANPVPAVPDDYPAGDLFEFLVPVSFHLQ
jgi:protein TonB